MTAPRPSRQFVAEDVLAGRVNLDGYPFRYVYLTVPLRVDPLGGEHRARVDVVFSAVEFLETRGWELVNVEMSGKVAYLRNLNR